ncbi:MAG TPA: phosphonate metabolism protein/1,5-bisphosphokinase (PRPP-forming) PhnN [Bradyrhizobium sp.]|nr:phosphonate metabolism protein/1,5-bisphosphokinase (PRPP-forming) PhnN [Bradyrhizobium sp.]
MSEALIISDHAPDTIGPGRLILVVGPSGAGKDTLLGLAKAACVEDKDIVFPRRVVTREASSSEDNAQLSADDFRQALARGDFAMHWEAHGHSYGLPREIDDDIRARRSVVVNASRTVIDAARRAYANVTVIAITAPPEVLAERLKMRSRSSDSRIEDRLSRTVDRTAPDVTILNVGRPEDHARRLVRAIKGE